MRVPFAVWLGVAALGGFAIVFGLTTLLTWQSAPPKESLIAPGLGALATGTLKPFDFSNQNQALPDTSFTAPDGTTMTLSGFEGKTVLVNLWATWCAPCVHELPTLDALQRKMGTDDFAVIAINVDRGTGEKPRAFLTEKGLDALGFYHDPTARVVSGLSAPGLPVTVLISAAGQEIGRQLGPADWNAPEVHAFIEEALAAQHGSPAR